MYVLCCLQPMTYFTTEKSVLTPVIPGFVFLLCLRAAFYLVTVATLLIVEMSCPVAF